MKKYLASVLLYVFEFLTRLPYTNWTSRLIDKLIVASEK